MNQYQEALKKLEADHLRYQFKAIPHLVVHWKMFVLAVKFKDWHEASGQIPRMLLALPGSWLNLAPKGNVGTVRMGIFEKKDEV